MTRGGSGRDQRPDPPAHQVRRPSRWGPPAGLARLAGIGLLLVVAYVVLGWFSGHAIGAHATAGGIGVGGLSAEAARATVAERAPAIEADPVALRLGAEETQVSPATAGLHVDPAGTIDQLVGFTLDPAQIWHRLRGTAAVPLRAWVDRPALESALRSAAGSIDRPVKEGSVSFPGGTVVSQRPAAGRRVDIGATADAVARAWPADEPIVGAVADVAPRIDPATFDTAVADQAARAVSGPIEVVADGRRASLTPLQFSPALTMVEDGSTLALKVLDKELLEVLRKAAPGLEIKPVDATVRVENGIPALVSAREGQLLDGPASAEAVGRGLVTEPRRAVLTLGDAPAGRTSEQVAGYGIAAELGRAATSFAADAERARLANATLAAKKLDGTLVPPGGTFSINQVVGPRTTAAGFAATTTALPGAAGEDDGGVGIVASAVYEAAFRSGLIVGSRTAYTAYVPGTSAGLDARASLGGPDATFTAEPGYGVLVTARVVGTAVEVVLYGRSGVAVTVAAATPTNVTRPESAVEASASCRPRAVQPGFDITVGRVVTIAGVESRRDAVSAHYAAVPGLTCG